MVLSADQPRSRAARFRELDALRGLAALVVVLYHLTTFMGDGPGLGGPPAVSIWWGEYGVQLFFLISGFVILLSARRTRRPSDFVISRVSHIYPVCWIALTAAIALGVGLAVPGLAIPWRDRLLNYTLVQRFLGAANADPVSWTLQIELQFSVLVLVLLVLTRCCLTDRVAVIAASAWTAVSLVVAALARPHTLGVEPQDVEAFWKILLNLLLVEWGPLFSAGMMLLLARETGRRLPAVPFLLAPVLDAWLVRVTRYALCVAVVVAIFAAVTLPRRPIPLLASRPLLWLGNRSYSLYVAHLVPIMALLPILGPALGRGAATAVLLVGALVLAAVYHRVGEIEATRWMRRMLTALRDRSARPLDRARPAGVR